MTSPAPLTPEPLPSQAVLSPISGRPSLKLLDTTVMGKYHCELYHDTFTDFAFMREPQWLDQAYSAELPDLDTGVLARNIDLADRLANILERQFEYDRALCGIDVGGGYGLFVRAMRDRGFDFYWSDPHTTNLFAKGFEADDRRYEIGTAFEVLEHLPQPLEFLKTVFDRYRLDVLFFSTVCFDPFELPGEDWWYLSRETGQHVSFYSVAALEYVARELDCTLTDFGGSLYAFAKVPLIADKTPPLPRRILRRLGEWLMEGGAATGRQPLTFADHELLKAKIASREA